MAGENSDISKNIEQFEQVKELISIDVLKTIQLLGFNYKSAIGEPLTLLVRNVILSKVPETDDLCNFERLITPEMVELLKDSNAYENFKSLMGLATHPSI